MLPARTSIRLHDSNETASGKPGTLQIGFRPSIDVHDVGRESLLNLVATSTSALGLTVEGVVFRAVADSAEELPSSAVWSEANTNPALTGLVEIARSIASDCPEKLADLPYKA